MHADQRRPAPARNGFSAADRAAGRWQECGMAANSLDPSVVVPTNPAWRGIVAVEHLRQPPEEARDFRIDALTVILHLGPPHTLSWGLAGASRRDTLVTAGSLSLLTAGARLGWCRRQATEALVAVLEPSFVAGLADRSARDGATEFLSLVAFDDQAIAGILRAMQSAMRDRGATSRLYGESLATALVSHLLGHYMARPATPKSPAGGLPEARLRRVLDYIETHLGEDTSLQQLAGLVHLSADHFAVLFRQSVGLPPHRYVLERRIARAKQLLSAPQLSLAEIGYALGYTSQPHFITMFRKLTGVTPGAYRKLTGRNPVGWSTVAYSGFREGP